ncbi:MAG: hypothetical protein M1436_05515 [Acidobacteria bacterium]|nr:hypothetical protein [Acidobacteriota bacterium]
MRILLFTALALAAAAQEPSEADPVEAQALRQLLTVRRVYVERLGGGETAGQIRDIIIASLQNARLFVITENQERADAVLKGSGEDLVFTESHNVGDSVNARASLGTTRTTRSSGGYGSMGIGENEFYRTTERRHEATASVRLINKEGDVIWSTTQESMGGKFRGASSDVADKITRTLKDDFERARHLPKK